MIITIHQPDFLPYPGFFSKIDACDLFVIGDHVSYRNRGFTNRNKIKNKDGSQWLTVPIVHNLPQPINKVLINNTPINGVIWKDLHLRTLQVSYGRAKYYKTHIEAIRSIYEKDWEYLAEFNLALIRVMLEMLGIKREIVRTSELNVEGSSTDLVLNICKKLGADTYISGMGGKNYLDESMLKNNGVKVLYSNFKCPIYEQQFPQIGFQPNMSIIDLVFNAGTLEALNMIRSNSYLV